jgi:polar amino acid transport system substrate-binding protein
MKNLIVAIASIFLFSAQPLFSAELTILTENLPPLNYIKDGKLVGPSIEIVKEIQRRVGSRDKIQAYPWARAYKIALEDENVVLFGMTHTKAREDKFK